MQTNRIGNEKANPYGCLYLNLQTILYKQGRYGQMHFNHYLACRMNVPAWKFNESDIRAMTGIHRRIVSSHCRALAQGGIFTSAGTNDSGSAQYAFDQEKLKTYLEGNTPLEPVAQLV